MAEIGSTLREARMRARIDITEVEAATKIRAKYLRAIENEEWDLLPGPVYVKSFLRTYGDYLGLDSRMLVEDYKRRYEHPSDHDMRPIATLHRERERAARGPLLPPWLVVGLVLVAVVAALWVLGGGLGGKGKTTPTTGAHVLAPTHPRKRARHRPARARPRASTVTLQLVPTGQVWVCLVDGSGKPLIPGVTFSPGQTIPSKTAGKLMLTLGNNSVQMKVNGKPVTIPPSARAIGFALAPGSTKPLPSSQQPRCA
jgi:Helix-turn-helix domain/RodZ C-terminal domain